MVLYKPLFKPMIDRNITKGQLVERAGVSYSMFGKMAKEENVNMSIIERICIALGCRIEDVVEILHDEPDNKK